MARGRTGRPDAGDFDGAGRIPGHPDHLPGAGRLAYLAKPGADTPHPCCRNARLRNRSLRRQDGNADDEPDVGGERCRPGWSRRARDHRRRDSGEQAGRVRSHGARVQGPGPHAPPRDRGRLADSRVSPHRRPVGGRARLARPERRRAISDRGQGCAGSDDRAVPLERGHPHSSAAGGRGHGEPGSSRPGRRARDVELERAAGIAGRFRPSIPRPRRPGRSGAAWRAGRDRGVSVGAHQGRDDHGGLSRDGTQHRSPDRTRAHRVLPHGI